MRPTSTGDEESSPLLCPWSLPCFSCCQHFYAPSAICSTFGMLGSRLFAAGGSPWLISPPSWVEPRAPFRHLDGKLKLKLKAGGLCFFLLFPGVATFTVFGFIGHVKCSLSRSFAHLLFSQRLCYWAWVRFWCQFLSHVGTGQRVQSLTAAVKGSQVESDDRPMSDGV